MHRFIHKPVDKYIYDITWFFQIQAKLSTGCHYTSCHPVDKASDPQAYAQDLCTVLIT